MSIESLLIEQARLSDLRRYLKEEGRKEASKCARLKTQDLGGFEWSIGDSCIDETYQGWKDECAEAAFHHGEGPHFDEAWQISVDDGEVCQHCQNVRTLKRQRMEAGRKLAGVRAAITRVGRRLAKEAGS
jgi:hypothetical protein